MARRKKLRLALAAWEPGRVDDGFGAKAGGLGAVLEELPDELIAAGERQGVQVEIELLTPCFAHYPRKEFQQLGQTAPVKLDQYSFPFEVFQKKISRNLKIVYFWDPGQLGWTHAGALYPDDPEMAFKLFASVSQAISNYIQEHRFHTVHGHDYHMALIPFYLGDGFLEKIPFHLTIHNASYQGIYPVDGHGYEMLERINLPGARLFHSYFDFFDNLNFLKAAVLKTHEWGGKVTTVSGDLEGSWGYAAELKEDVASLKRRAREVKVGAPVGEVFLANRHLDVLEKVPVIGITNGLNSKNHPSQLPELNATFLREAESRLPEGQTLFRHPEVETEMLSRDHFFDTRRIRTKKRLKRLLHLECFGQEPEEDPILLAAVGRLVEQKNLSLVAEVAERSLALDPELKFVILASAPEGDPEGKRTEMQFRQLSYRHPSRFFFESIFNAPLSKLILAGSDFALIPSRFEPCGLVDYEASLLGSVVIGHRVGGLAKVDDCAYLYEWLDLSDRAGEARAFFHEIERAVATYRDDPAAHARLMRRAMKVDASWEASADQYLRVYRSGLLLQEWRKKKRSLLQSVVKYGQNIWGAEPALARLLDVEQDLLDRHLMQTLRTLEEAD